MNVTANIVCYKSKTLANGEHPLMVRICKDGKKKYKSLGVSVNPKYWNFERNTLKPNCPNFEYLSKLIANKTSELSTEIVKLKSERKEFTASTLIEDKAKRVKPKTVHELFYEQIQRLTDEGRRGYMLSVKQVYNSLLSFNKHLDICFSDIDVSFLRRYETWLRKQGLAENTIGIRFRTLRAIYNLAMEEDIVDSADYPFKKYKVARLHEDTAKRSLSKEDIDRILAYKSTNRYMRFPIDIFAFTYYCGGINFIDIANLTSANIIEGKLVYKRHKTSKLIKIPLQPQAVELIKKYQRKDSPYLFPILSDFHETEIQKSNRIHKVISKVNKRLKEIGEELGLPLTLTTYVARHSQATVMKKAGVSTAVIREIMGHSSERVTQIYLDSFDNEQIDNAMKNLL
ncbi:site-specific integrase [uncultured Duncaniella sp.]|uniref:site-specific integrase n=1 Tax=uncultured Duncaniella sp. TaxID=2768039 RepID=UPI0025FB6CF9|nr:site-specific integrase [uncultured Duncaniella sp.]